MEEVTIKTPLRILHLEDQPQDRQWVEETLAADGLVCQFIHVAAKEQFEAGLEKGQFDVILSDFTLPSYHGLAALAAARTMRPEIPFLFVSGTIGAEGAVEGLKLGAADFVLKADLPRLGPAVRRALRETREGSERKLLGDQMRQAQTMEAIGRLAGGIAHDFNNLLTVIRGSAELMLMKAGQFAPEVSEYLKLITVSAERAANLTDQLLTFGCKHSLRLQPLSLNDVVKNLTKVLHRILGEDIRLECLCGAGPVLVQADAGMIERVLMNLAVNARDAMPRGGQLLVTTEEFSLDETYARAHPEARAGEFVCLIVSDTGGGIAPEHLPRIFEPFFTTKAPGQGAGLGLATVHGIVKQHHGWIQVSSRPGAGTTFEIFLPAMPPAPAPAASPQAETAVRGGTENILLVEDDAAVRSVTRRILEAYGYHVREAASGREALEVSRGLDGRIDLLLTDIVMPDGVSGRELSNRLSAQTPGLKVIYTSGYSRDVAGHDTTFIQRSRRRFLQKPCPSDVLLNTVRRCLDGKIETVNDGQSRSTT
jgi:two-component system cell cycle sensor histidine kinase/response regulator CckA